MAVDHRAKLAKIRRFDQLIAYLRDELGWPIGSEDFEDLTFEYTPEELGIDSKNAAKIQEIKRLRPLSIKQPWGIFFIKFEPKRLPVVALRRILSRVTLKKRASANSAERAAWSIDDILFISNYGEDNNRQISIAHFSQGDEVKNIPTLKVLGWDYLDTALHLDNVAEVLTERLKWPKDEDDEEKWRSQWRSAFSLGYREVITTSKRLSVELAKLARNIRNRINAILAVETKEGPITKLMDAFKEALIHDLSADDFADMYAQTIAYGLLSARIANPSSRSLCDFATALPVTNPFLKELMETFLGVWGRQSKKNRSLKLDFDELGVSEVVDLLNAAKMEDVVLDFGDRNPQEDPVIHFYELFLKEYDAKKRMQRGVFYTPRPVVSFIVRSVDELLRTEFGLEDGLADTTTWGEMVEHNEDIQIPEGAKPDQAFVQILDPATGTGTFLVEVIDLIYKTMIEKWQSQDLGMKKIEQLWNDYVEDHLLTRLHGYELMMAPYAIAHTKIGLKLYETGYRFESDERTRIYLTNTLEPAQDFSETLAIAIPALAHEAKEVNVIKRNQRFTVVIGNPPYAGHSANTSDHATNLVNSYYFIDGQALKEKNTKWLRDDYVKFIRYSQLLINMTGIGIMGFITNHGYLDNPTFRGMRQSLMSSYDLLWFLDLHGSVKKIGDVPDGIKDENVFDIQQGVAIALLIKTVDNISKQIIKHLDLWGNRKHKYNVLVAANFNQMNFSTVYPSPPNYLLIFQDELLKEEYNKWWKVTEAMPQYSLGCLTKKDKLVVGYDKNEVINKILSFIDTRITDKQAVEQFDLKIKDKDRWNAIEARKSVDGTIVGKYVRPVEYRVYDTRWIFYHDKFVARLNTRILGNMRDRNIALVVVRQLASLPFNHVWVINNISEQCIISNRTKEGGTVIPLYLFDDDQLIQTKDKYRPNMNNRFIKDFNNCIKPDTQELKNGINISPLEIFNYIYAVLHSQTYRYRYRELLKRDFPRIPLPSNIKLLRLLSTLGAKLISIHLMNVNQLNDKNISIIGEGEFRVERVSYADGTVWIDKSRTCGFCGIPEKVWSFKIGSYQVCEKWLKDRQAKGGKNPRPGRVLSDDDIVHYQKIVVALNETIRIMAEIDEIIEIHGGWPGAFQVNSNDEVATVVEEEHLDSSMVAEKPPNYE